jgi:hypothetical protein
MSTSLRHSQHSGAADSDSDLDSASPLRQLLRRSLLHSDAPPALAFARASSRAVAAAPQPNALAAPKQAAPQVP